MKFLVLSTLGSVSVAQTFKMTTLNENGGSVNSTSLTKNSEGVWEGFVNGAEGIQAI